MKMFAGLQLVIKSNLILDNSVIHRIADTLNNDKTKAEILRGHILVSSKVNPTWELMDEIHHTVKEIYPAADKEIRLRPEIGFAADDIDLNPAVKSIYSEFTVNAVAGDNPIGRNQNCLARPISIDRLVEKRYREDVTSDSITVNGKVQTYYELQFPRRIIMVASARLLKMNPERGTASFLVEFFMLNIGRIDQPYATINQVHYIRELTIPEKKSEAIGLLDYVGKKVASVHNLFAKDSFADLYSVLETAARNMIEETRRNNISPDAQLDQNISTHLNEMVITFPDMITTFLPLGYNQSAITAMQKQYKNLQDSRRGEVEYNAMHGKHKDFSPHRVPSEYDIAPDGLYNDVMPSTLRVKVPTDFRNLLIKHVAFMYAVYKTGNDVEIEESARIIEAEIRRRPELLKPIIASIEERGQAEAAQAMQPIQPKPWKAPKKPKPAQKSLSSDDPLFKMQQQMAEAQKQQDARAAEAAKETPKPPAPPTMPSVSVPEAAVDDGDSEPETFNGGCQSPSDAYEGPNESDGTYDTGATGILPEEPDPSQI
jgi:hypothetical protein